MVDASCHVHICPSTFNIQHPSRTRCRYSILTGRNRAILSLHPLSDMILVLMERLLAALGNNLLSREAQANASLFLMLATCRVLEFHLSWNAFAWVLGEIEAKFNQPLVNPSGTYETLAIQSISEPAMQMMLNTAGVEPECHAWCTEDYQCHDKHQDTVIDRIFGA